MDNSFFVCSTDNSNIEIERLHICNWEFGNNSTYVEFGVEINRNQIPSHKVNLQYEFYIPWLNSECIINDFYEKLKLSDNSQFIFNDYITNIETSDGGKNLNGVTYQFLNRNSLYITPINFNLDFSIRKITIDISLETYNSKVNKPNIYFRFAITAKKSNFSTKKIGIGKAIIIYDLRINEKRNLQNDTFKALGNKQLCKVSTCFFLNIVPNKYDLTFFESECLKSVRTLELESFRKYLNDKKIKKDNLIVVFSKKSGADSYSFFSIFSQEKIGPLQYLVAIFINIICSVILFIPSYQKSMNVSPKASVFSSNLPYEFDIAIYINVLIAIYIFFGSRVISWFNKR